MELESKNQRKHTANPDLQGKYTYEYIYIASGLAQSEAMFHLSQSDLMKDP